MPHEENPQPRAARLRALRLICLLVANLVLGSMPWTAIPTRAAEGEPLMIFAAASLQTALDRVADAWMRGGGAPVSVSYAASSALARQIDQGAPADIFASADNAWMDWADGRKLIRTQTRQTILRNTLVLIAPTSSTLAFRFESRMDLAEALMGGRLAVGEVETVPAGKYAKAALTELKIWETVKDHIAQAANVRAALALVAHGEAPLGIVYGTDAIAEPRVRVVATFPESSHPPIVYPFVITATSRHPAAANFLAYLHSAEARRIFGTQGFAVID